MRDGLKHTAIYADYNNVEEGTHVLRLVSISTDRFPHGLPLGFLKFKTKEDAIATGKDVDIYIDLLLNVKQN